MARAIIDVRPDNGFLAVDDVLVPVDGWSLIRDRAVVVIL